jgi:hypothetical protein
MEKQIVFVGGSLVRSANVTYLAYHSNESLLDGDIVVFSIDVSAYSSWETYLGMRCLDDDTSFRLRRDTTHWHSELRASREDGKTIIVFINNEPIISLGTGRKEYSGTGRNARTTRIVENFDPYSVIPVSFGSVVRRSGERIKEVGDLGFFATYWHEFGTHSTYEGYIENFKGTPLLETQTGRKVVGGYLRSSSWKGVLLFAPAPDLESVVQERIKVLKARQKKRSPNDAGAEAKRTEGYRRKAEQSVASQFIGAVVALDKSLRNAAETTPPPVWSLDRRFSLSKEEHLHLQILDNVAKAHVLVEERLRLDADLEKAQRLKSLLFEKGKRLEEAILIALRLLGFKAVNLQEGDSEFDAVMVDPAGIRLIGEAEGKDDRAISVDKLDQLDRNLKEDFSRQADEGAKYAHGVLFGNAYRLSPPAEREQFFTAKCMIAAERSRIILVRTPDLFEVARYLQDHTDAAFAELCRASIINGAGKVVEFPNLPK